MRRRRTRLTKSVHTIPWHFLLILSMILLSTSAVSAADILTIPTQGDVETAALAGETIFPRQGVWSLVWADEFDSGTVQQAPNPSNWGYETGYVRNQEWQYYTTELRNAYCQDGALHIQAYNDPSVTYPAGRYTGQDGKISSASLISLNKVAHQYGLLEMRAKIDTQLGSWPAFWNMGVRGEWPDCGECDVMEYYQDKLLFNAAWWKTGDARWTARWDSVTANVPDLGSNWVDEFHDWAMEWTPTEVRLYMDGHLYNTWDPAADSGDSSIQGFQQPHYIIINQAIGGTAGGDASVLSFPTNYEMEWVRWYQDNTNYIDDGAASITYSGTWQTWSGNPGYQKTEHYSETTGSTATFTFTGDKVWYYGAKRNDLGIADILIDGQPVATVDCYSANEEYFVSLYESPQLTWGQHELTVRVSGEKNAASKGPEIIVDGYGFSAGQVDHMADGETTSLGQVSGSIAGTLASDNVYEAITESATVVRPNKHYSSLQHTWTFNIGDGGSPILNLEAYHSANTEGDDFEIAYSKDNSTFTKILTVQGTADTNQPQSVALPGDLSGVIYVRVTDTDRTQGRTSLDTIYIDKLSIQTGSGSGSNRSPSFTIDPIVATHAIQDQAYSSTIRDDAADPDVGDQLTFSKIDGPAWLDVSPEGNLSGTPLAADVGPNSFTVAVNDGKGGTDQATLQITVDPAETQPSLHIAGIAMSSRLAGKNRYGQATVSIKDGNDVAVNGATVSGQWSDLVTKTVSGTTLGDGTVFFESPAGRKAGTFTFTVTNVVKSGYAYHPEQNNGNPGSINVP